MTTERLFYKDSFLKTCTAVVLDCKSCENWFEIRLNRTVFYPEGGGQPYDTGMLNEVRVWEVQEKDDEIWHYTKEPMEIGTQVEARIDWERRFDLMQQHSGEHIVSGMIHEKYGYHNVGFHMGAETITIDFDGEIPERELREIENKVNQYIWENHSIHVSWPSKDELGTIPYRSKKALSGDVRIVTWPGADICACCGVHVKYAGEIGQVVFLSSQRFKGGVRIEMVCGKRTQDYLHQLQEQNRKISQLLSAKWKEIAAAVEKLHNEYQQMKFRMIGMEYERISNIVKETIGVGNVLLFENQLSPENARKLSADVMEVCGGVCAVFCGNDEDGYRYAIGEKNGDLRGMVKEMNGQLCGRGGGKPFFVQGSLMASQEAIQKFFEEKWK